MVHKLRFHSPASVHSAAVEGWGENNLMNETQSGDVNGDRLTHESRGREGGGIREPQPPENRRAKERNPGRGSQEETATQLQTTTTTTTTVSTLNSRQQPQQQLTRTATPAQSRLRGLCVTAGLPAAQSDATRRGGWDPPLLPLSCK